MIGGTCTVHCIPEDDHECLRNSNYRAHTDTMHMRIDHPFITL